MIALVIWIMLNKKYRVCTRLARHIKATPEILSDLIYFWAFGTTIKNQIPIPARHTTSETFLLLLGCQMQKYRNYHREPEEKRTSLQGAYQG